MSEVVISVENLTKEYRLGTINHGTLYHDLQSWWARIRGKEDPNSLISAQHSINNSGGDAHFLALKDVSFDVKQGEVLGIIGRNGAGKSTLLKILSKVTAPTSGTIKIKGRVASLLEVGTGFHPELTGRENIFLNGAILGMTKVEIQEKFDEIVAFAEIEKFLDTPVKRYSSGMYVRLAFAVAAHLEPEILIVDEVLAVGDAAFQKKCLGKMGEVAKGGRTVLFVSHNMGAVRVLCSRGIFISNGQIKLQGKTSDVVERYLSDGFNDKHTITYDIDPSKPVHFTRVSLYDHTGKPSTRLDMLNPFRIEIEYIVHEPVSGVLVGCNIISSLGESIIATTDGDIDRGKLGTRNKGINKTFVNIPGKILNSGLYLLVVGISIPGKVIYDRKEVMNFELYDSGSFVVNGGGEVRRNSLLLLGLQWDE